MHRRDYRLIARVIAETAQDAHQRDRWTAAFMQALHSSPDNFNATKFLEGVTAYSNEVRAGRAPRAGGAPQPPASSTAGRADPEHPDFHEAFNTDAPQHFADENTPADHYYRS